MTLRILIVLIGLLIPLIIRLIVGPKFNYMDIGFGERVKLQGWDNILDILWYYTQYLIGSIIFGVVIFVVAVFVVLIYHWVVTGSTCYFPSLSR